jgi:hypothetical protein
MSTTQIDEAKVHAFMRQAVADLGAAISAPLFVIGEKLGLFYGASTVLCTPASRSQEVGLALGAQAGEAQLSDVPKQGGFTRVRRGHRRSPDPGTTPRTVPGRDHAARGRSGPTGRSPTVTAVRDDAALDVLGQRLHAHRERPARSENRSATGRHRRAGD